MKVFFSCPGDDKFQGYSYNFELYYGSETNFAVPDGLPDDLSISEQIVLRMLFGHLDQCHMVIT